MEALVRRSIKKKSKTNNDGLTTRNNGGNKLSALFPERQVLVGWLHRSDWLLDTIAGVHIPKYAAR